jgi:amino acid adenylation domain-containing protein
MPIKIPPEQEAIRRRCFHPSGKFVEFPQADVDGSIPERFEKIVRLYADWPAVKTKEQQFTYDALNRQANRLAHDLLERRGAVPEPVAIFLDHWDTLVITHLGVLKAGKFSLALDPAAEIERTRHLLKDSGARVVIVDEGTINAARGLVPDECLIVVLNELKTSLPDDNPRIPILKQAHAYIRYTSGSTGSAKGTIKSHHHVLKGVMDFINDFHLCPDDRVALVGFASIGKHLFEALLTGACFCPYDARKQGLVALEDWMRREKITLYYSFPTALRYFMNGLSGSDILADLRLIELEGEPVYATDMELVKKHVSPECILVNTLSSAETGTVSLYFLDMKTRVNEERVPVGYPVEGMEILILDEAGQPLEFEQVGEVAVRSSFLCGGYWGKPDVTSRKFISQGDDRSSFMYLTGDLGRLSQDGCLHLLGRKDFQVKIRSFRVDVTEVEAALVKHREIRSAAVIGRNDQSGNTRLIAYVVPWNPLGPTVPALKSFLHETLPEYMIPAEVVFLEEIPLMSTGKVNRRALPEPESRAQEPAVPVTVPRTAIEEKIADIWREVLSLKEVEIHDNFFDLGGHSLAASLVISRVIQTFQLELPVKSLFEAPTVAAMATIITEHQAKPASDSQLAQMLHDVEAMTEEEVQRRLAGEKPGSTSSNRQA